MTSHIVAPAPSDPPLGDVSAHESFGSLSSLIRRSAAGVVLLFVGQRIFARLQGDFAQEL